MNSAYSMALPLALLLAGSPAFANSSVNCSAQSDVFKEKNLGNEDPDDTCRTNAGAEHDKPESAKDYESVCYGIYVKIRETIQSYRTKKAQDCAKIQQLVAKANNCGQNSAGNQNNCQQVAEQSFREAATIARGMAKDLQTAEEAVRQLYNDSHRATEKYQRDKEAIAQADKKMESEIMNAQWGGSEARASELAAKWHQGRGIQNGMYVEPEAEVGASNGSASTIQQYRDNMDSLLGEQEYARKNAGSFSQAARMQMERDNSLASSLDQMAATARTRYQTGGRVDTPGGSRTPVTSKITGAGTPGGPTNGNTTGSSVSNPGTTAGGMPAGGMPAGGAPAGSASPAYTPIADYSPPSVSSPSTATRTSASGKNSSSKGSPGSVNDVTPRKSSESFAGGPSIGSPGEALALGGGSDRRSQGRSSGSSRSPSSTGASTGSGGGAGAGSLADSSSSAPSGEAQALSSFATDLSAQSLGIKGSEVNAAMSDLVEEFGGLGLTEGGLTDAEKAAFAPLEGMGGSGGQSGFAVSQGADPSLGGLDSEPLFDRTRAAHFRALQRGELIRMVRTRL